MIQHSRLELFDSSLLSFWNHDAIHYSTGHRFPLNQLLPERKEKSFGCCWDQTPVRLNVCIASELLIHDVIASIGMSHSFCN